MPVIAGSLGTRGLCNSEAVEFVFYRQMMKNRHHLEIKWPSFSLKIIDRNILYLHRIPSSPGRLNPVDGEELGDSFRLFYWNEELESIEYKQVYGLPNTLIPIYHTNRHELPVHVIVSPISGSHSALSVFERTVKPFFEKAEIGYRHCILESISSMKQYIDGVDFNGKKPIFLLLSGDGVFHDLLNCYKMGEFDCCLIPCGTANALASSVGIFNVRDGIRAFAMGTKRNLTPLYVTVHGLQKEILKAGVVVSWGFHAQIVSQSETLRESLGVDRFKIVAQKLLAENKVYDGTISTASKTLSDTRYLLISRVPRLEKTFIPCPTARLNGPFTILHISSSGDVEQKIREAYHEGIQESDGVNVITTDSATIEIVRFLQDILPTFKQDSLNEVCIDGYITKAHKVDVELAKEDVFVYGFEASHLQGFT